MHPQSTSTSPPTAPSSPILPGDSPTARARAAHSDSGNDQEQSPHSSFAPAALPKRLGVWLSQQFEARRTPALLTSVVVHTALLLLLAVFSLQRPLDGQRSTDFIVTSFVEQPDQQPVMTMAAGEDAAPPTPVTQPDSDPPAHFQVVSEDTSAILQQALEQAEEQRNAPELSAAAEFQQIVTAINSGPSASFASTGVDGRQPERRRELARQRGGTIESELAVERALEWLAAHQLPSGAWSLVHNGGECNGRCRHPGSQDRFDPAATGLALLAFLGAGYTHQEGKHRETVRRGVYYLHQIMEETPLGGSFLHQCERGMYNHGIAAFALCEAYQLTGDEDIKRSAQLSVDFIASAQSYRGGWGYLPKQPGDLTISGWQTMALKSAQAAGLEVSPAAIFRLDTFLDSQQLLEGSPYYGYTGPGKKPTCTAIGNLLRLFRGRTHTDPTIIESAKYLEGLEPSRTDIYFNYYVSLYLFHAGGPFWELWNPLVRDFLVSSQASGGHEAGSWHFDSSYGKEGGRLYTTAMAAMTLEVYYRFSPLYQQADQPFEL